MALLFLELLRLYAYVRISASTGQVDILKQEQISWQGPFSDSCSINPFPNDKFWALPN